MRRCNNCSKRCNVKCAVEMPLTQRKTCTFQTSTTQASVMSFAYHAANDRSNTSAKLTTRSRTPDRSNPAFERQHVSAMFHHVIATSHKDNKSHNWRHGNVIAEAAQPQFRIRQSNSNGNLKNHPRENARPCPEWLGERGSTCTAATRPAEKRTAS